MSDRKQQQHYYPPDYDPKKGSLNTQLGQHVLRKRANRLDEGILVVRYEQPYNAWCLGCGCHIGKGVRFNADKQQVGMYFTTKIWQFSMTCHQCKAKIVVRTDPKNAQYVMFEGIRGKDEQFTAADNDTIHLLDADERKRMTTDALFRTEHGESDKTEINAENARIKKIYAIQERRFDDFGANQALRRINRAARKESASALKAGAAHGLPFALAPAAAAGAEDGELDTFRKRKALEDYTRAQKKETRKKTKLAHTLGDLRAHSSSAVTSLSQQCCHTAVPTPAAAAASAPSFAPSSLLPLMMVPSPARAKPESSAPSAASSAASVALPPPAADATPSGQPSHVLLGLAAYGSDDD